MIGLNLGSDVHDCSVYVSTPVGESMVVTHVYYSCLILFVGFRLG